MTEPSGHDPRSGRGPRAGRDPRPCLLVTGIVSDYRRESFRMLAAAEGLEVAAFREAGRPVPGLAVHRTSQLGAARLAASGRYRAVICGLGGRAALPGAYLGARRAGVPFVLWATIWAHPRTPAHLLSYLPTLHLYRHADAIVTYGPHVSAYVAARRGTREGVLEAPQAVDERVFAAPVAPEDVAAARSRSGAASGSPLVLFVGRLEAEKGMEVLLDAFERAGLGGNAVLALAGNGPLAEEIAGRRGRVRLLGPVARPELPALYAAADVLVLPSIRTATFTEPWGLVVNEAMHQGTPVIASDAVGAAAGGLVQDGRNGFVVPAGDARALATRLEAVCSSPDLRSRLGQAARGDVARFTHRAWVEGFTSALATVGVVRTRSC